MYKEIKTKIEKNEDQINYSEEQVVEIITQMLLKKSEQFKESDIEDLRKNWKKAFTNGLSILGMIHGVHSMGNQNVPQPKTQEQKVREAGEIKQARLDAQKEAKDIFDKNQENYKEKSISNFLDTISMNESSGGKNTRHEQLKNGIHAGDSAIGQYGLMPNTIKEMATRMGKDNPMSRYAKMDNSAISESIKKNPGHESEIANFMANHLHKKFGGDESKMAYAWNQGHNLTNDHFVTSHKDYKKHDYVNKFNKHKSQLEKTPKQPEKQNNPIASIE